MSFVDTITVEDFKSFFTRNFPYLPVYQDGKAYAKDDVVYVEPVFYQSLIDNNVNPVTDETSWMVISDDVNNYVQDSDIEKAMLEAKASFNEGLGGDDDTTKLIYLYLVAFYLSYDLYLAQAGAYGNINFPATEVKVGSVSEGYYIPKVFLESPVLSFYTRNGFGLKYLALVYPKLIGNVGVVAGWSLP